MFEICIEKDLSFKSSNVSFIDDLFSIIVLDNKNEYNYFCFDTAFDYKLAKRFFVILEEGS